MTRQEVQGMSPFTRNEGRAKLLAKNRQTFILQTTKLTRIARRVCEDILQPRRAARRPYASINANAVKAECKFIEKLTLSMTLNTVLCATITSFKIFLVFKRKPSDSHEPCYTNVSPQV